MRMQRRNDKKTEIQDNKKGRSMNLLVNNLRGLWHSFELDVRFLLVIFFDVLFLLGAKLLSLAQQVGIQALGAYVSAIPLDKSIIASQSLELLQSIKAQTLWVIVWVVLMSVLFVLLLLAIYSVCNYVIWLVLLRKKESGVWRHFWSFYLLNLVWFAILGIFLLPWIMLIASKPDYIINLFQSVPWLSRIVFALLGILIILHPLLFLQSSFFKHYRLWKTIACLFTTGFGNLPVHIVQYVLSIIVSVIVAFVVVFVQQFVPVQARLYVVLLAGLMMLNWFKAWFIDVENQLEKNLVNSYD